MEQDTNAQRQAEIKEWKVIYPIYINKAMSRAKGRRVPKNKSVENPTIEEIIQVLTFQKVQFVPEKKQHPKDFFTYGRIRFRLKNENGGFYNNEIISRMKLLEKIGEQIPKLKSRNDKKSVVTEEVIAVGSKKENKKKRKGK